VVETGDRRWELRSEHFGVSREFEENLKDFGLRRRIECRVARVTRPDSCVRAGSREGTNGLESHFGGAKIRAGTRNRKEAASAAA
jgi:hypothetical protein